MCLQHKGWVEGLGREKSRTLLPVAKVGRRPYMPVQPSDVITHGLVLQAEQRSRRYALAGHCGDVGSVGGFGLWFWWLHHVPEIGNVGGQAGSGEQWGQTRFLRSGGQAGPE